MSSSIPPPSRAPPAVLSAKRKPVYPHLADLVARAEGLQPNNRPSITAWVDDARVHWEQAKQYLEIGILDSAYVNYLLAFTIIAQIVPGYQNFKADKGSPYKQLSNELREKQADFTKVKEEIRKNNQISGVSSAIQLEAERVKVQSFLPVNGVSSVAPEIISKRKPEVRAKPEYLSARSTAKDLSQIRGPQTDHRTISPRPEEHNPSGQISNSLDLKSRFERLNSGTSHPNEPTSLLETPLSAAARRGHREMPAKLPPLNVNSMPTIPPPTYSPATSLGGMAPSRSVPRSSAPRPASSDIDRIIPRPSFSNDTIVSVETLHKYLSKGSQITVLLLDVRSREKFDDGHIQARSIVCIEPIALRDGMSGDDLDRSFVLSPSREQDLFSKRDTFDVVVYYDQSMSDNKFLSGPTQDENQVALRSLHMAIYDYAFGKRLQRPPMLLLGGLDAWIDFFGKFVLVPTNMAGASNQEKTSRPESRVDIHSITLEMPRSGIGVIQDTSNRLEGSNRSSLARRRQERESQRVSMSLPIQRASYSRKSEPMPVDRINIEEEKKWMERLQREREPLTISVPPVSPMADGEVELKKRRRGTSIVAGSDDSSYVRTVEEFFQRYPAQQSMMSPIPPTPLTASPMSLQRQNTIIDHPFYGFTDVRNPDYNPPPTPVRPPPAVPRKSYSGVSERLGPSAPPLPPPARAPEIPPKIPIGQAESPFRHIGSVNIGKTGLKNLGNTCYMNSILQCMSGTIPLSRYFMDGSYRSHINKANPLGSRGVLAEAFASVVKNLWSGEFKFISPVTIKDVSGRLNEMFKSNDQQDAQEYLEFLLDGLHEDLNPHANRGKLRPLTDEEERRREKMPQQVASYLEWQRYTHQNFSVVVNWFQGQLSSRLMCLTCGTTSTTYSPFMYLSLPIPTSKRGGLTLADCLEEFVREEILEKDDAWHCPNCKKARKATKKLTITRLPHMLIIHLKRFTNRGLWRDKLNTIIDFPLKDLNLTKYVPPLLPKEALGPGAPEPTPEVIPPFLYDLYGVCNHYGTLNGGHYTSVVRNCYNNAWNLFDDSKASFVDDSSVVSRSAYVLFWVRSNVM